MIYLANIHGKGVQGHVEYIGRESQDGRHRRSPLCNPFSVDRHGPDLALRLYRIHLANALAVSTPSIVTELARLQQLASAGDLTIGCWCAERPAVVEGLGLPVPATRCHGDLVATVLTHWGVRLATYARVRCDGDTAGPERWAAWVKRDCGPHPHAVMAMVFGFSEVRAMAAISAVDLRDIPDRESERLLGMVEAIAAGMSKLTTR
jgi:hypothetical protein